MRGPARFSEQHHKRRGVQPLFHSLFHVEPKLSLLIQAAFINELGGQLWLASSPLLPALPLHWSRTDERQMETRPSNWRWWEWNNCGHHPVPLCENSAIHSGLYLRCVAKCLLQRHKVPWGKRKRSFEISVSHAQYLLWACHPLSLGGLVLSSYEEKRKALYLRCWYIILPSELELPCFCQDGVLYFGL